MLGAACKDVEDVQGHRRALAMSTVAESTVQTLAARAGVLVVVVECRRHLGA